MSTAAAPPRPAAAPLPSLDGLRALSILMVVGYHAGLSAGFPPAAAPAWFRVMDGAIGVRVFFAISGYLITRLLLREERLSGRIALGRFYARRALRILPVYYAYLAAVVVLALTGLVAPDRAGLGTSLVMLRNTVDGRWFTGHLWSLAVEQHFYLAWPLALVLVRGRGRMAIVALAFGIAPAYRAWCLSRGHGGSLLYATPSNVDCLLAGALAALGSSAGWLDDRPASPAFRAGLRLLAAAAFIIPWQLGLSHRATVLVHTLGPGIEGLAAAYLIHSYASETRGPVFTLLNLAPVRALGVLSYSLYIWQQPFLVRAADYGGALPRALSFPWNLLWLLPVAVLSNILIERPFLRARRRLA